MLNYSCDPHSPRHDDSFHSSGIDCYYTYDLYGDIFSGARYEAGINVSVHIETPGDFRRPTVMMGSCSECTRKDSL